MEFQVQPADMPAREQRHGTRRANCKPTSKPYSRKAKHDSANTSPPASGLPEASPYEFDLTAPHGVEGKDKAGFPTYTQYKRLENAYLTSLSDRKRDKALITQDMFDNIWDVLSKPDTRDIETAQFRFWVRKMFTFSDPEETRVLIGDFGAKDAEMRVVLHEGRPVAIKEQLYELLAYCHGRAKHGGRDKTCAVIRQHYSWVPKELTSRFVKACPTCTLKRSGNPDLVTAQIDDDDYDFLDNANDDSDYFPSSGNPAYAGGLARPRCARPDNQSTEDDIIGDIPKGNWPSTGGPLDPIYKDANSINVPPGQVPILDSIRRPPTNSIQHVPAPVSTSAHGPPFFDFLPTNWSMAATPLSLVPDERIWNRMYNFQSGFAGPSSSGRSSRSLHNAIKPYAPNVAQPLYLAPGDVITGEDARHYSEKNPQSNQRYNESESGIYADNNASDSTQSSAVATSDEPGFFHHSPKIDPCLLSQAGYNSPSVIGSTSDMDLDLQHGHRTAPENAANAAQHVASSTAHLTLISPESAKFRRRIPPASLDLTNLHFEYLHHRSTPNEQSPTASTPSTASSCYSQQSFQSGLLSADPFRMPSALGILNGEYEKSAIELEEETAKLALDGDELAFGEGGIYSWMEKAFPTITNLAQEANADFVG